MRACSFNGSRLVLGCLLFSIYLPALSQTYPTAEVKVVTESAGSSADFLARYLVGHLGPLWKTSVVIDNQGGKSAALVAKSEPSGYVLLMGSTGSLATGPNISRSPAYNPVDDFSPVALVSKAPLLIVAHPSVPADTLKEFIDYGRKNPNRLLYSSGGIGTAAHLTTAYFTSSANMEAAHKPYKGAKAGLQALLSGETQFAAISASTVVPQVKAGNLKAYAVTTASRFPILPDIPAAAEAGLPGFEATAWYGLLAPKGTPASVVRKINSDVAGILHLPETKATFLKQGAVEAPGSPEDFAAWVRSEYAKWGQVVRAAGLRSE